MAPLHWLFVALVVRAVTVVSRQMSAKDNGFIVVVNQNRINRRCPELDWRTRLHTCGISGLDVIREFRIGSFEALFIRTVSEEDLDKLRQCFWVKKIEFNSRLFAHPLQQANETEHSQSGTGNLFVGANTAPLVSTQQVDRSATAQSMMSTATEATIDQSDCLFQHTGYDVWGLSRISTRAPPGYSTAMFSYSNTNVTDQRYSDVIIYVLDTGIYTDHEEFEGRATWGHTSQGMTSEGDADLSGHGTFVAGVAAGKIYGVAKSARLVAVKVLNINASGLVSDAMEGIQWTVDHFRNESLSSTVPSGRTHGVVIMALGGLGFIYNLEAAIQAASDTGLTFVISAGNYAMDTCLMSPGRMSSVITVASTDINDTLAETSNFGPCIDILAPGEDIPSASIDHQGAVVRRSGTSVAAPHVAGAIAKKLAHENHELSPALVKGHLLDTATTGFVEFSDTALSSTPNKLVYTQCVQAAYTEQTTVYDHVETTVPVGVSGSEFLNKPSFVPLLLLTLWLICITQ